jgi:hypothetical protein
LSPVQQSLNPLQEAAANIGRTISGQPPLKVPIPGKQASSWLLITWISVSQEGMVVFLFLLKKEVLF